MFNLVGCECAVCCLCVCVASEREEGSARGHERGRFERHIFPLNDGLPCAPAHAGRLAAWAPISRLAGPRRRRSGKRTSECAVLVATAVQCQQLPFEVFVQRVRRVQTAGRRLQQEAYANVRTKT